MIIDQQSHDASMSVDISDPPLQELDVRLRNYRGLMERCGVEVAILTTPESIYYISGYQTRAITASQFLIVSRSDIILIIRRIDEGNYLRIIGTTSITDVICIDDEDLSESSTIAANTAKRVSESNKPFGVEPNGAFTSWNQFERLRSALGRDTVDVGSELDALRLTKSDWELRCHREAARITVATMRKAVTLARPGVRDSELAAETASALVNGGSEWVATWPIVQCGANTGRPHSSWRHEPAEVSQPINLEFSAAIKRYHSPLYRSVITNPTIDQTRLAEGISAAHTAGLQAVEPGATADRPYEAELAVLRQYGLDAYLVARVGYSVGISFAPNWVQRGSIDFMRGATTVLQPGMVFHMVTILLRANEFGIAHSSTVLVTPNGREVLTDDGVLGPILKS